jgi:hypothetical protein
LTANIKWVVTAHGGTLPVDQSTTDTVTQR